MFRKQLEPFAPSESGHGNFWHLPCLTHDYREAFEMASSDHRPGDSFAPHIGRSVSLDHAAQLLGVSRRTIYNRIRDGRLQTVRTLGGSQRVLLDSVEQLIEQMRAALPPR